MQFRHLHSIDMLRGLVALLVCLYHFTEGFLPEDHFVRYLFSRGYLGVEIFFVISGFVIPFTMFKSRYAMDQAGPFILKRLARIEPPYWCSIALIFLMDYAATFLEHYKDKVVAIDYQQLFFHILHLNDFLDQPWLRGIYWSLAIEVQYYLLAALIYPLLVSKNNFVLYGTLLVFCMGRWLEMDHTVFYYGCHFSVGMLLFHAYTGRISRRDMGIAMLVTFALTYWCFDLYHLSAVVGAAAFIYQVNIMVKPLVFMGMISYSFYLIHIQIGWTMMDGLVRYFPDGNILIYLCISILVTIFASWLFYWFIERPSHRLSRSIRYNEKTKE